MAVIAERIKCAAFYKALNCARIYLKADITLTEIGERGIIAVFLALAHYMLDSPVTYALDCKERKADTAPLGGKSGKALIDINWQDSYAVFIALLDIGIELFGAVAYHRSHKRCHK